MTAKTEIIQSLRSIPWFLELKTHQIDQLVDIAQLRLYEAGEEIFAEGQRANDLYIILDGQVKLISYVPSFGEMIIFHAEPLDIIGWTSMTSFVRQRTSSASAVISTHLLVFNGSALRKLCDQDHDLGYVIMKRMSNVIASHLLTTRLHLYDLLQQNMPETHQKPV